MRTTLLLCVGLFVCGCGESEPERPNTLENRIAGPRGVRVVDDADPVTDRPGAAEAVDPDPENPVSTEGPDPALDPGGFTTPASIAPRRNAGVPDAVGTAVISRRRG